MTKLKSDRVQLKSIKLHTSLSEETPAYTAKIYVDGKFFSNVSNRGHGGPDEYDWEVGHKELTEVNDMIAEAYGNAGGYEDKDGEVKYFAYDLEIVCHELAWRSVDVRNFASQLSRKSMILTEDGSVFEWKCKISHPKIRGVIADKYPTATILNDMKAADAFDLVAAAQA